MPILRGSYIYLSIFLLQEVGLTDPCASRKTCKALRGGAVGCLVRKGARRFGVNPYRGACRKWLRCSSLYHKMSGSAPEFLWPSHTVAESQL